MNRHTNEAAAKNGPQTPQREGTGPAPVDAVTRWRRQTPPPHAQLRWLIELSALHMVYENGRAPWRKLSGCCGNSEKAGWLRRKLYRHTILYRTRRPSQRGGTIQHGPNHRLVFHNFDPGGASAHSDPRPLSALATPSQERQSIASRGARQRHTNREGPRL